MVFGPAFGAGCLATLEGSLGAAFWGHWSRLFDERRANFCKVWTKAD